MGSLVKLMTFASLFVFMNCKQPIYRLGQKAKEANKKEATQPTVTKERLASGVTTIDANKEFYLAVWNEEFMINFAQLPKSGSVASDKLPYSGFWYPESHKGTAIRWDYYNDSALEKYDAVYNGGVNKATDWETSNHGQAAVDWAGHCNGWSAAAQRHKEPARSVTKGNVTFEPRDIKALLAEIHMSAKPAFLGGNRCDLPSFTGPSGRSDPTVMGDCEDINPGVMHVVIANWIGRKQHIIIMDRSAGNEVWNSPLYKYSYTSQEISKESALQQVTGTGGGTYRFNPNAQSFALVTMSITHAKSLSSESNTAPTLEPEVNSYQYVLELDGSGNIIGGEWTQQNLGDHPDFIWLALEPVEPNGTRFYGNPNLNINEVIKLWAESIGADPTNPPLDIMEPEWSNSWGKFASFEVALDGASTGAAFLGKNTILVIKPEGDLTASDVTLDLTLNGVKLATLKPQGSTNLVQEFTTSAGINRIDFVWKKGETELVNDFVRFHAIP